MEIVMLGTSAMVPTKERNHSAALLLHEGEGVLMDCGEGTQRQLKYAGVSQAKITHILLSHWHGDHVLGLPGLLMTCSQGGYSGTLHIYGPKDTSTKLRSMFDTFIFEMRMKIEVHEITKGKVFESEKLLCTALPLSHNVPWLGFRIEEKDRLRIDLKKAKTLGIPPGPALGKLQKGQEISWKGKIVRPTDITYVVKGKVVAFVTDTTPNDNCHRLAENADLLICEASYASDLQERAEESGHMTALQAATLAHKADAKKLVVTHFSARYTNISKLIEEARTVFKNTTAAEDLMKISVD
jgi:ribonuclease Z